MRFTRHALRGLSATLIGLACLPASAAFLLGDVPAESAIVDYRAGQVLPDARQLELTVSLGATRVNWNRFGTVHSMIRHGGYLAGGYGGTEVEAARQFILDNSALFRLSPTGVADLELVNDGVTPGNPGHAVLFRQTFAGLPSANDGLITIGVVHGKIYYVSSSSAGDQPLPGPALLTPVQAWLIAAADVNRDMSPGDVLKQEDLTQSRGWHMFDVRGFAQPQRARLRAMPIPAGGVRQVWETIVLDVQGARVMAYVHFVDAGSGEVLRRENRVNHQAGGGTTNNPFNGAMPDPAEATCASHEFDVPEGMATLSGTVAMAVATNDILLNMYYIDPVNGRTALPTSINDTGTSPESVTYQPSGTAAPGTYELEICWYDDPTVPAQEPYDYAGNFAWTDADSPDAEPFPPQWSWFTSNPDLGYTGADVRTIGCWFETNGCTYELANLAARAPWDVNVNDGKSTFTTVGNAAKTAESWGSPLTPSSNYAPTSNDRYYVFPFENIWNASKCDPSVLQPGGNDIDAAVTNLFVSHNRMHDWSYFLGFTERNYNMQLHNFGLTTTDRENDPEVGNVQAAAVNGGYPSYQGRDNANQVTLQDGVPGITNQYLFQPIGGSFYAPCADGDFDMTIVGHEYTHAINNRMIGGPDAGIGGPHAGAMGESWGDLTGVEYQVEYGYAPDADPTAVGPYATGNAVLGIRDYSLADNPLHLGNFGFDTPGAEVHADGEIWNAVMWGVRQELVDKYNAQYPETDMARQKDCADGKYFPEACPGNRRWIAMLFDAYLLMPASPSFLDARDAMLAADVARFDGANQAEMWRGFARFGMGENAYAADASDVFPIANFESPYEEEASVKFVARAGEESDAPILNARIILGEHATRSRHLADTDPMTVVDPSTPAQAAATGNNSDVFKVPAGTYKFIVEAEGYGQQRFTATLPSGGSTLSVSLPSNRAALARGSSVITSATAAASIAAKDTVIDDSENTGARIKDTAPVAGAHATVTLNGGPFSIRQVNVSTAAGPDNPGRFSGVRQFEIRTCNGPCLSPLTDFDTVAYTSPDDAFPGDRPRPVQPQLNMRTFSFDPVIATHVQLRVLTSQCTGFAGFAGDQDNDPSAPSVDCTTFTSPVIGTTPLPTPPGSIVRLTELQVFGSPVSVDIDPNLSPVIDAGAAFTLDEGASGALAGTATDADTPSLAISWTQTGGPAVTGFTGTDTLTPGFTAPQVAADTPLTFELAVSDGIVTVTDTVVVTVRDLDGTGPDPGSTRRGLGNTNVGGLPAPTLLLIGLLGMARLRRRR